jgi:serine/threonine protein kinase
MAKLPIARTPSFGDGNYSQTRRLLAPRADTIDMEANPYDFGNRPLKHLNGDGVFYIRGVKYVMVPKEDGGYIGGGAYGKVWLAKRDPEAPKHDLRLDSNNNYNDIVAELLNASDICVKVFRVEKSKNAKGGITSAQDARREMQLHARAGHYVHGVMAILAVTDIPASTDEGPVTIDSKWTGADESTHWVVMACEIARNGNLRRFISPLDQSGKTLLTQIEGVQKSEGLREEAAIREVHQNSNSESVVASLQTDELALGLIYRLLLQLQRLHAHGILHLDLKPENITINQKWELCIIDFGLARPLNDPTLSTIPMLGTLGFRAPEKYGSEKADVFSAGMILYCLIVSAENPFFGTHPLRDPLNSVYKTFLANSYLHDDKSEGIYAVVKQLQQWYPEGHPYRPRLNPSKQAASLVARMTCVDPSKRPTITECLNDPWFQGCDAHVDNDAFRNLIIKSVAKTGDALKYWKENIGATTIEDIQKYRNTWVEDVESRLRGADINNNNNEENKKRRMQ